ncbi:excinuclease ABC subunit UvrA [Sutterella sp.]|uniref:excinuclease ABC subunit UvrA n=1 Tax=Sutterella sp. TaxID=1981025 RepID=UPI0026DEC0AF|nr:excinuclease ABC subunit UvrA [Sutterella sp.]MDO5532696.1 excinuclease ABC subunit UvrA [Sutterella sp.]
MTSKTDKRAAPEAPVIRIRGAEQNNLKNLDLDIPVGGFTVVTGLSGSGKSSLVFDTLYAEGQRRYVETFSPYARQFLDRMDRPKVRSIEGVPPAIAIDQNSAIRTSRSTVGTMTEINDRLKLLFAREAHCFCPNDGSEVGNFTPDTIWADMLLRLAKKDLSDGRTAVCFERFVPKELPLETARAALSSQGFTRILAEEKSRKGVTLLVAADRFRASRVERSRAMEAVETALKRGEGALVLASETDEGLVRVAAYRVGRVCPECGWEAADPKPSDFSFNSPVGACPVCRGFGRVIATDMSLVIPDRRLSLMKDAVKPFSTASFSECKADMLRACRKFGIDPNVPYDALPEHDREIIEQGEPGWTGDWTREWYGIGRFFEWLESKSYKMHVRVMLSRYRAYRTCTACAGARLKPAALAWRVGTVEDRSHAGERLGDALPLVRPVGSKLTEKDAAALPGFNFHELMLLPATELRDFLERLRSREHDAAEELILGECLSRIGFLCDVGLGYLTMNRQGRTLSGGEVQRVNLTTALGTNLVNTLFVLDEPSIGLHPRDMDRVNSIMRRLTAAGNTLVVVEHDPQVMLAGERLIDLGPGAGAAGGEILFEGSTRDALVSGTETSAYLSGKKRITRKQRPVTEKTLTFTLAHATANNLRDVTVSFPLGRLITVAGVSGSGKSSLIVDTLVPALTRRLEGAVTFTVQDDEGGTSEPRIPATLSGTLPKGIEFVDQSSLGRTTRGNPASYVKAFTGIREIFGASPEAVAAGLKSGDFSFNSGAGRCPRCAGTGWEHVEMQFLSDVYLPCPACSGKRYQEHILAIRPQFDDGRRRSIADVLELTVDEAVEAFAKRLSIVTPLKVLQMTGLGYLKLGQPLTTLSGGERQRLKLSARLAEGVSHSKDGRGLLFVFDEPTTGLHFADSAKLVDVFDRLTAMGSTVIVIEHNLDVIGASDWVIELGPDGGAEGGRVVFEGSPEEMMKRGTLTGDALSAWRRAQDGDASRESFFNLPEIKKRGRSMQSVLRESRSIVIEGAREHNLRDLSVDIPRETFTVVTGPSGSGKSTLAFDIVFAEGQRRFLESLNAYARSMVQPPPEPDVSSVRGIPPTVAIEQRTTRGGMRSTVATMTELYHFLRLVFVKLGTEHCPDCGVPVAPQTPAMIAAGIAAKFRGRVAILVPVVTGRKGIFEKEFLKLRQKGVKLVRVDGRWEEISDTVPKLARNALHTIEALVGHADAGEPVRDIETDVLAALGFQNSTQICVVDAAAPRTDAPGEARGGEYYSLERACPSCGRSLPELDPRLFSYNAEMGACPACSGYGVITAAIRRAVKKGEAMETELADTEDETVVTCPDCRGARLNPVARSVLWEGKAIQDICAMTVDEASEWFAALRLDGRSAAIARDAVAEIRSRLEFLKEVGLNYLTLERSAPTLSGGETQRIHLASQLGTNLRGVCYVLDEPTIGLHPRDNAMLLNAITSLTRKGNTLLVVEHDEETIRRADHVIDIGPGAGARGGRLMAEGTVEDIMAAPDSPTGRLLANPILHTGNPARKPDEKGPKLTLRDIRSRNLHIPGLTIPLERMTVVTGVSGSGKSTLCREVLFENLRRRLDDPKAPLTGLGLLLGQEKLGRVLEVDQSPIGKNPRSCPATYVGVMTAIRDLFASANEAKERGFDAGRFTFNKPEGACPLCAGQGLRTVEMSFLPDVKILCEACGGMRFNPETLAVLWKGKSIGDVLRMEIDEAVGFFATMPSIAHPLKLMQDVGLGYLTLGQPSPTLSGGEAQRLKLVTELAKVRPDGRVSARTPRTLYVLDEPTVGLHMADVKKLTDVLSRLVDAGSTVVMIEHNLDVIADADWVIDLGPEGGAGGGEVVGEGIPSAIARRKTATGQALKAFLKEHKPRRG